MPNQAPKDGLTAASKWLYRILCGQRYNPYDLSMLIILSTNLPPTSL